MKTRLGKLLSLGLAATLAGACAHKHDDDEALQVKAKYLLFAADHSGYMNIYGDDGGQYLAPIKSIQAKNMSGDPLGLGETHFNKGKAFVVVQSGMQDMGGNLVGGGILIIDLHTREVEKHIPLKASNGIISRIVHTYEEPGGKYLWLNNDGPNSSSVDADGNPISSEDIAAADSVFRINWDPTDTTDDDAEGKADDKYLDVVEIVTGNGHSKSAFSYPTDTMAAPKLFATHNLTEESVSIIDNDPTSASFLTVVKTVDLKGSNAGDNTPHGLDYSTVSGHFYVGITKGIDKAVAIIDANSVLSAVEDETTGMVAPSSAILVGDAANGKIPAGGYIHASKDGNVLYMVGAAGGEGYLSVISAADDTVAQVLPLGPMAASSFVTVHAMMDHGGGHTMALNKIFIGASSRGTDKDVVQVIDLEMNGMAKAGDTHGYAMHKKHVGVGGLHRNGTATAHGEHVFFPNGGDCNMNDPDTPMGPGCSSISVLDGMSGDVTATLHTAGHMPGSMATVDVDDMNVIFEATGSGTTASDDHSGH